MSDTHSGSAAPLDDAPPASSADATVPAPLSVDCPGCGAKLRNISAEPGAKIRCLNCGARFVAIPAAAEAAGSPRLETDSDDDAKNKPSVREPQSAGYWILRIPAMIFALITPFAFVLICYGLVHDMYYFTKRGGFRWEYIQSFLYAALLPLAGFFAYRVTRALARGEAGAIKAAWHAGLLRAPLPSAPGSSLPYILPLTALPIVTMLVGIVTALNREYRRVGETIPMFLAVPAFFLLGFMADDLRQFLWRQQALADNCARNAGGNGSERRAQFPWLGLLLLLTFATLGLALLGAMWEEYNWRHAYDTAPSPDNEYKIMALTSASLFGAAATFFLLGRNFLRAIGGWWHAAQSVPTRGDTAARARREFDVPMIFFRGAAYVFLLVLIGTVISGISRHGGRGVDFFIARVFFLLSACGLLTLSLVRLLADARAWRKAQTQFWLLHGALPAKPVLSTAARLAVFGTIALALLQSILFIVLQSERFSNRRWSLEWEDWMLEVPIACFSVHASIVWIALFSREFMLAECAASDLRVTKSAADERGSASG